MIWVYKDFGKGEKKVRKWKQVLTEDLPSWQAKGWRKTPFKNRRVLVKKSLVNQYHIF